MQVGQPKTAPAFPAGASRRARTRFGLRVDRLSVRLAVGIALIVVAPLTLGLYLMAEHHFDRMIGARRHSAEMENRILEVALRHQMIEKDTTLLTSILDEISTQAGVVNVMILNHEGKVRVASRPELVGQVIPIDDASCLVCHSKEPDERSSWVLLEGEDGSLLRSVLPIQNKPECHRCHDPEKRLNGILVADTSLDELQAGLRRDALLIFAGAALLAVALLLGVGLLVRRLILVRLARLRRTARAIAAGDLSERAAVEGDDVISSLATDFNYMADAVTSLVSELRGQEEQLASVMNSLSDGLVVLDREGRVVASNRAFCRRLGTHPQNLRGQGCSTSSGSLPCCASEQECPARRCLDTSEVQRVTYQTPAADGGPGLVEEVYASPVFDDEGQVVQVVELWRDITERAREEERLAEIERLVSLGALASGFSHEVNTPLASMLTCAEGVLSRIDERRGANGGDRDAAESLSRILPEIREHAETIRAQVLRCRRITEQFLRFSRGIPPSIEPLDLRRTVAGVVALVGPTARDAGVELRMEGEAAVPAVTANAEVVQHVVLNLLINAIQAFDDGGGEVTVSFLVDEDVRIQVRDTGCGIAATARERLFEPFHSWKANGTGLGLFLSRSFMRRFGGDVRLVESRVGAGSCFEVRFAPASSAVDGG